MYRYQLPICSYRSFPDMQNIPSDTDEPLQVIPGIPQNMTGSITGKLPSIGNVPQEKFAIANAQASTVTTNIGYTQAYLKTLIGKNVIITFLIGTDSTTDRLGVILGVGISYILIKPEGTDDVMLCDIYSIKFVTVYK
jgi:hypothetical protein